MRRRRVTSGGISPAAKRSTAASVPWMTVELPESGNREGAAAFQAADLLRRNLEGLRDLIYQHHVRGRG
jgi:hypothetical protein